MKTEVVARMAARHSLALRIRRSAFALSMLIFVLFGGSWLTLTLIQIPDVQTEAHLMTVRVIGEVLSNDLNNQIDNLQQLSSSSLVWTAMTDSAGREGYLRPFLTPVKQETGARRILLDYQGRILLGELPLGADSAQTTQWVQRAQAEKKPRVAIVPFGAEYNMFFVFPVLHPYSKESVGAVLGVVNLRESALKRYAGLDPEMGIDFIYQNSVLLTYPNATQSRHFPVDFAISLNLPFDEGSPSLRIFATRNPWVKPISDRILLSFVLALCIGTLVWNISGVIADRITHRLQKLANACESASTNLELDIAEDNGLDEISVLARTLKQALSSYHAINANLEALVEEKTLNLAQSEERFRAIIEASPIPYALNDGRLNIIYLNAAFTRIFGYTREDIPHVDNWWHRAYPDIEYREKIKADWFAEVRNASESHRPFEPIEAEICCKDGSNRTVLIATAAMTNSRSDQHVVSFFDITTRKQAEEHQRLAATVFSHAREGILITDADGTILDVNAMFCQLTGYSRNEALGNNPRMLRSGHHPQPFYADMWNQLLENSHWSGEIWNRRRSGEIYPAMLTISAVRDSLGKTKQYVALFSDITEIKNHERQLERMAQHDALTNLPNRTLLADRLEQAMLQALRRNKSIAICYLDLDGFKGVNDRHGHEVGDRLLVKIASVMKNALREPDTLARIGGDEFVAILLDMENKATSLLTVERLVATVSQPLQIGEVEVQVSVSIGVTFFPQENDINVDQLLRQADLAMYQAKATGKNRYHVFDKALEAEC